MADASMQQVNPDTNLQQKIGCGGRSIRKKCWQDQNRVALRRLRRRLQRSMAHGCIFSPAKGLDSSFCWLFVPVALLTSSAPDRVELRSAALVRGAAFQKLLTFPAWPPDSCASSSLLFAFNFGSLPLGACNSSLCPSVAAPAFGLSGLDSRDESASA